MLCVYILTSAGFTYIGALTNIIWTPVLYFVVTFYVNLRGT